jgi:hypothetical protein
MCKTLDSIPNATRKNKNENKKDLAGQSDKRMKEKGYK